MPSTTLFVGIFFLVFRFLSAHYSIETLLSAGGPPVRKLNEVNETEVVDKNNKTVIHVSYIAALMHVDKDLESLLMKISGAGSKSDSTDHDAYNEELKLQNQCMRSDFDGTTVSGALSYAIAEINASNLTLPNHELHYMFNNSCGEEKKSTEFFMDHWARGAKAFFGPEMNCRTEALMAAAQNLPILSYKCKDTQVSDKKKYTTFARTVPADSEITKAFVSMMKEYNWKQFTIIYEDTDSISELLQGLKKVLEEENSRLDENEKKYTILNTTVLKPPFHEITDETSKDLDRFLDETKLQTRLYVTFGNVRLFRQLLLKMGEKGMTDKQEHLLIYLDPNYTWDNVYRAMNNHFLRDTKIKLEQSWGSATENTARDLKMIGYIKSAFAIIPTPSRISSEKLDSFWAEVDKYMGEFGISRFVESRIKINRIAYFLYDAVWLYATALHEHISSPEIADKVAHGYDPISDGKAIIKRILNRRYTSFQGYEMTIDKNGNANGNYTLISLQKVARVDTTNADPRYYPMDTALDETGMFVSDENGRLKLQLQRKILWDNDVVPKDQPECGFHGELCLTESKAALWVILVVILIVLVGVTATALFAYRSQKFENDLQSMWKIHPSDLEYPVIEEEIKEGEKISQEDFNTSYFVDKQGSTQAAQYKGGNVFVKKLFYNKAKNITRQMKLEMLWMVRLGHPNINKFMGITMDQCEIQVVREKCERGSLMDILRYNDDQADNLIIKGSPFMESFINDIIEGMTYLHNSDLKVHGNLKSTNCLITTRWQVQLADFGLNHLRVGRVWKKNSKDNDGVSVKPSKSKDGIKNKIKQMMQPNKEKEKEELCPKRSTVEEEELLIGEQCEKKRKDSCKFDPRVAYWENLIWTAPELLVESNFGQTEYQPTQKGDVYAFGIILHEIAQRSGPLGYLDKSDTERGILYAETLLHDVVNGFTCKIEKLESNWMGSDVYCMAKCIESCLSRSPENRPDFRIGIRKELQKIIDKATSINMGDLMVVYQNKLEDQVAQRTCELYKEQKITNELLHRMLPPRVAQQLLLGKPVKPSENLSVTIYFSDIVGFTKLSGESTPLEIVNLLNLLYLEFDNIIKAYHVYKVETIGDAYMVVAGLDTEKTHGENETTQTPLHAEETHDENETTQTPLDAEETHDKNETTQTPLDAEETHDKNKTTRMPYENAYEIAAMAIHIRKKVAEFVIPHRPQQTLNLRIGIHTGQCAAGVVGNTMPRYCLFGDTVNTASRMESTGLANMIHCSKSTRDELTRYEDFEFRPREPLHIKGKGEMTTYFLEESPDFQIRETEYVEHPQEGSQPTLAFLTRKTEYVQPYNKNDANTSWGVKRTSNLSLSTTKDCPPSTSTAFGRKSTKLLESVEYSSRNGGHVSISCNSSARELASVNEEDSGISNISSDFSRSKYTKSHNSRIEENNQRKRSSSLPDCKENAEQFAEQYRTRAVPSNISTSWRTANSHSMESIESDNREEYPSYHDLPQTVTRKHGMGFTIWPTRKRSLSCGDTTYTPSNTLNGGAGQVAQSTRLIQKSKRQRRRLMSKDRKSVRSLQPTSLRDSSPYQRMRDASPLKFFGSRSSRSNTQENGSLRSLYINECETPSRNGSVSRMILNKFKFGSSHQQPEYISLSDEDDICEEENEVGTSGSLHHSRSIKTTSTNSVNESSEPLIKVHPELMV